MSAMTVAVGGTVPPARSLLPLLMALTGMLLWFPLAYLGVVCLVAALAPEDFSKWLLVFAACVAFTALNSAKDLMGDLVYYTGLLDYLANQSWRELLDADELKLVSGSYRVTEVGFYGILWALAQWSSGGRFAISILSTLGIYIPTMLGLFIMARREQWSRPLTLTVALFVLFAGINFMQTTHLLRQYVSSSLVFLAFSFFLANRKLVASAIALYACTVHNGTALLVISLVALAALFPAGVWREGSTWGLIFRVVVGLLFLGATFGLGGLELLESLASENAEEIGIIHYAVMGGIFALYLECLRRQESGSSTFHYVTLAFGAIYVLSIGFFILGLGLFALRYYLYLEWLLGPMLAVILGTLPSRRLGIDQFARWLVCFAATGVFVFRFASSPWTFAGAKIEILASNFPELVLTLGQ